MQASHLWTILNLMTILLHIDSGLMSEIRVLQSPAAINVTEGGSVQFNCTFEVNSSVGQVVWRQASKRLEVSDRNPFYQGRILKSGPELFTQKMGFLKISDLMKIDSDVYYCEVEILSDEKGTGPGTQLSVTDKKAPDCLPPSESTDSREFPLMLGVLGLFTVVVILLLSRLYYQSKVISRLNRSRTVTLSKRDPIYELFELEESLPARPSRPRQATILPYSNDAAFLEYSTVNAPSSTQSTFQ